MIKVGTLVGLMVMPGEDWTNVKIPSSDIKEISSPAEKAAASNSESANSSPSSSSSINDSSSSHLQMYATFL